MVNISEVSETNRNDLVISNVYFMCEIYIFICHIYIHLPFTIIFI